MTSEGGRVYKDKLHPHNDFIVPKYDVPRSYQYPDILRLQEKHKESFDFMHWLMNEVSHLGRMEKPVKKSRVINVLAKYDEYMPTYSGQLEDIWDGEQIVLLLCVYIMSWQAVILYCTHILLQ